MTTNKITVVNLNMGNIGSIPNMLKRLQCETLVTNNANDILRAEKIILPGVGSFDAAMNQLNQLNLIQVLNQKVLEEQVPILGICLGMQLFTESSEEGRMPGLGWISGKVVRFKFDQNQSQLKIPHMGWNYVQQPTNIPLLSGYESDPRFYFVHSYHVEQQSLTAQTQRASCQYGYEFPAVIWNKNILGAQFHPEKSHRFGLKLFENFIQFSGAAAEPATKAPVSGGS